MKNENHSTSIMNTIRLFLIGLILVSGGVTLILYGTSSIFEYMTIESWLSCWLFSLITLCGMPVALLIDWIAGMIYEKWGRERTKTIFLFITKTIEGLLIIGIVHQADKWLEGINCSTWSETFIGYSIFLILEGVFAFGNWISNRLDKMEELNKQEIKKGS